MHVHIASMGKAKEPVIKGLRAIPGIDKVYILASQKYLVEAEEVKGISEAMMMDTEIRCISGFNFQEITENINRIHHENYKPGVKFSINITGGTNLMAAAACSCAFLIGATIYYVQWDESLSVSEQLQEIPMPHSPNLGLIKEKTRDILQYIYEQSSKGPVSNADIIQLFAIDKQNSGYHLRKLESEGLIKITKGFCTSDGKVDNRRNTIHLTDQGKMVALWMRNDRE